MKLPKSVKKYMKMFEKQNIFVKVIAVAVLLYAIKYVVVHIQRVFLDSHYLEGFDPNVDGEHFIFFKMDGCGHCDKLYNNGWSQLQSSNKSGVPTEIVNANNTDVVDTYKQYIDGYPTLLLINKNSVKKYDGDRTASDMEEWLMKNKSN